MLRKQASVRGEGGSHRHHEPIRARAFAAPPPAQKSVNPFQQRGYRTAIIGTFIAYS
jgi:hypothetical protein